MDPVSLFVAWLSGKSMDAAAAKFKTAIGADTQESSIRAAFEAAVRAEAAGAVIKGDPEHALDALLRESPYSAFPDLTRASSLEEAVSGTLRPTISVLEEQGYRIDGDRLTKLVTRDLAILIKNEALHGGPLEPIANRLRDDQILQEVITNRKKLDDLHALMREASGSEPGSSADRSQAGDPSTPDELDAPDMAELSESFRSSRKRPLKTAFTTGLVLLLLGAVVIPLAPKVLGQDGAKPKHQRVGNSPLPTGSFLKPVITYVEAKDLTHSLVLPPGLGSRATQVVSRYNKALVNGDTDQFDQVFNQELKAGAYAYRGVSMQLNLQNIGNQEVAIDKIEPRMLSRRPQVNGTVVDFPGQAGGISTIWYDLDKPAWIPRVDTPNGRPFFATEQIGLAGGGGKKVNLEMETDAGSYAFNIAIHYTVAGKQYVQYATREHDKKPLTLRATASLCDSGKTEDTKRSTTRVAHYSQVYRFGSYTNPNAYHIFPVSVDEYASNNCQ